MVKRKIVNRWLYNSLGVIVVVLMLVELAFGISVRMFYYNSVNQTLSSQLGVVSSLLTKYAESSTADFGAEVRSLIENFDQKDKMELMALGSDGNVLITSSGFPINEKIDLPDFSLSLSSPSGRGEYRGNFRSENGRSEECRVGKEGR